MLASIFQNSKSALAFAASVIVCALMLVGPKESGGVLDKAVTNYKDDSGNPSGIAGGMSGQTSAPLTTPLIGDYKAEVSGLEEPAEGTSAGAAAYQGPSRVIRLDPVTGREIGVVPSPPPPGAEDTAPATETAAF